MLELLRPLPALSLRGTVCTCGGTMKVVSATAPRPGPRRFCLVIAWASAWTARGQFMAPAFGIFTGIPESSDWTGNIPGDGQVEPQFGVLPEFDQNERAPGVCDRVSRDAERSRTF